MEKFDRNRIKDIVKERLLGVTPEIKEILPPIFRRKIDFFTVLTNVYFILDFVDKAEKKRIKKLMDKNIQPFPYLIKSEQGVGSCAFKFEKSKFVVIEGCTVENMFSLCLGKDSTIILHNHTQKVQTKELDLYKYLIELAFVISFGDDISHQNFYDALEDLIAHSLEVWRSKT